ncbi:pyruvate kinase [Cupriavidus sp. NPDC089707]|uniref:pyruvate kinase n=1 Tax=Cupriavidus sp. NPDC089707 TaxID=3363963 RepID=UPI003800BDCD
MRRERHTKIVATLGPASSTAEVILQLFKAGADTFRLNFSHGTHEDHQARLALIREAEALTGRPAGVLLDLQGPKLRLGTFPGGPVRLTAGQPFRLQLDAVPGSQHVAHLPHREIFEALRPGHALLIDDGRVRLRVREGGPDFAETIVETGGTVSDRKGVNVPDCALNLSALTEKDQRDLRFGMTLGVDWVALSFVQSARDIEEVRAIVGKDMAIMAKIEKPAALADIEAIVGAADGIMVARGDLGVEMPPEEVPAIQKRLTRLCREAGKPLARLRRQPWRRLLRGVAARPDEAGGGAGDEELVGATGHAGDSVTCRCALPFMPVRQGSARGSCRFHARLQAGPVRSTHRSYARLPRSQGQGRWSECRGGPRIPTR